nr:unnamed protein product [Callosobruchus chinensis]
MIEVLEGSEDDYNFKVVTHGDLWPNNVVYNRNNDGKVAFLDFHACRLSSPVHDLQLLLLVGLDTSTRRRHGRDLILSYHRALTFPYSALERQLMDQSRFAMGVALAGLPLFLAEETATKTAAAKASNVEELFKVLRDNKSTRCKSKMLEIVVDMVDQDYL